MNLSLSASNMCLMLRFKAWAVYQSCSFWKLGSCVSPMMSGGACCAPLCSTSLAEWDRAGQSQSFLKGVQSDPFLPLLHVTHHIQNMCMLQLHRVTAHVDGGVSLVWQQSVDDTQTFNVLLKSLNSTDNIAVLSLYCKLFVYLIGNTL